MFHLVYDQDVFLFVNDEDLVLENLNYILRKSLKLKFE